MRHNLKSGVLAIAVVLFLSPFCCAGPPELLEWEKALLATDDNAGVGNFRTEASPGGANAGGERGGSRPGSDSLDYAKLHKALGYTAVILAGLTAVSSGSRHVHYGAAYGTALAAAGAAVTGHIEYRDRFNPEDGLLSRDNGHILLGTLGAVGCIAAVALADSHGGGGHAGAGILGGGAMALSIVTIKW